MNSIAVLGLGKVGTLVGVLLNKQFSVKGYGLHRPHYEIDIPFPHEIVDISNMGNVHRILDDVDAVVSALPYYLNKSVAEIACQKGVHYFDLTEDVKTTQHIKHLKESASAVLAPQCGLAPGFIGIIGGDLSKEFDEIRDIELRVGALPRYPNGQLSYSFTWSQTGVINEYLNDAEVIHNGKRKIVPSLDGFEVSNADKIFESTFQNQTLRKN